MELRNVHFAKYILITTLLLEFVWFFLVWALMYKTQWAGVVCTLLLPALALLYCRIPAEKRELCTAKDLKLLNDLARGAFFATAAFAVMMLLGVWKYLSADFVKNCLFSVLIAQFALHVFAILLFSVLAVLAPKNARKKPIKLAVAIYVVSTLMQLIVFPETLMITAL